MRTKQEFAKEIQDIVHVWGDKDGLFFLHAKIGTAIIELLADIRDGKPNESHSDLQRVAGVFADEE